jgi:hypothetical protein
VSRRLAAAGLSVNVLDVHVRPRRFFAFLIDGSPQLRLPLSPLPAVADMAGELPASAGALSITHMGFRDTPLRSSN